MDQHYLNDEFDQFLKENADQHKMYPSDRVWANIKRQQHGDKRRVVYIGLFLLVAGSLLWLTVNPPAAYRHPVYSTFPITVTQNKPTISVTVDDIIAKLRAKSLIPPMEIDAPVKLKPLGIRQRYFATLEDAMPVLLPPVTEPSPAREIAVNKPAPELALEYHEIALPASDNQRLAGLDDPKIDTYPGASPFDNEHQHEMALPPIDLRKNRSSRLSVMMSFAPSIGYRNLFDGSRKITGPGNSPVMVQKLDVNEFVDHKPAIGFELGGHLKYELSKTITLRGGLQLNLARYNIQAFAHTLEKTSLPINNAWGYQSDSLVVYSNIRNIAGNRPVQLKNQYLQVSLPVGAEIKLFGYSKFQVSLAGTLQPTYLLNADQYLLTNNFTNYAKEPSLIRRWNLATGLEAFFSYQRGDVRWQIGPQFRYNLLSTSNSEYPIRENLMEYGLKIGISRPLY